MAFELDNVGPSSGRPLSQAGDQYRDLKRLGFVVSSVVWFIYVHFTFHDTVEECKQLTIIDRTKLTDL